MTKQKPTVDEILAPGEDAPPSAPDASIEFDDHSAEAKVERAIAPPVEIAAPADDEAPTAAAAGFSANWSIDLFSYWSEAAMAYLEYGKALSKVKTPAELIALQTRFATERFNAFVKRAQSLSGSPKSFFFVA